MREVRKPLVLFTPKCFLRRPESRSSVDELTHGSFQEVLDDPGVTDPDAVRRLVFCSGKVAFDALARRDSAGVPAAVIRVEQLFPFPRQQLLDTLARYPNAKDLVWLQEEPENMGAWRFMYHRTFEIRTGATRCASWPGWSRAAPPPARPRSTSRSRTSCSTRPSAASEGGPD